MLDGGNGGGPSTGRVRARGRIMAVVRAMLIVGPGVTLRARQHMLDALEDMSWEELAGFATTRLIIAVDWASAGEYEEAVKCLKKALMPVDGVDA